ncbi:transcriptional regulator AraC family [Vibrio variabilis]|uniref:Transcriptional regulator AraC family n=1 Tax=Vibrio variabilis TaxID=990271 RepID=A0ABQ0J7I5_9VIBR|nr:transcriptional regulator AraC family [Vibrio variabilis]
MLFTKIEELINLEGISAVISLLQLLSEIDRNQEIEIISKTPDKYSEVKIEMKISAAVDWIDSNYFRKISLDDVASKTNMNKHAFCRAFKHETGKTPMHYINEKRIEEAANLLLKTHKSITEIGFEVGFTNVSSFNRNFKTIRNTSPKAYREMTRVFSS